MPTLTIRDWARVIAVLKTNRSQKLFVGFFMYPSSVVGSDVLSSRSLNSLPALTNDTINFEDTMTFDLTLHVVCGQSSHRLESGVSP